MTQAQWIKRVVKPAAFLASLGPFAWLVRDTVIGNLGANPVERITHFTGLTALTFLMITLGVTPARRLFRLGSLIQLRRMLGLFAFFYAVLHFTIYGLDRTLFEGTGWSLASILEDVAKRPYITVGFTAFLMLSALAATSTNGMVRRLGGKRWQRLHQLVYVAAALGVLHFLWLVKADIRQPATYGLVLVGLLGVRLVLQRVNAKKQEQAGERRSREPAPALESS
jgi:sulfoxide reductase heme-binding subunit YedZ